MTAINPFSVQQAQFGPAVERVGLAIGEQVKTRAEHDRLNAEKLQLEADRKEMIKVLQTGTPEEIVELAALKPHLYEDLKSLTNFQDELERDAFWEDASLVLSGQKPLIEYLHEKAQEAVDTPGEDANMILQTIALAETNPEQAMQMFKKMVAVSAPKRYKAYADLVAEDEVSAKELAETAKLEAETAKIKRETGQIGKPGAGKPTPSQKTGSFLVKGPDGVDRIAVGSYDPLTGTLKTATAIIEGEVISKLGETPSERRAREVSTAGEKTAATGTEQAITAKINRGVTAAETTAVIRRGIELLDLVKTGGYARAALAAKRTLGIESANEGELSNSLGKAVLSQLRETFGAAFTENEGKRLERIEAAFGKSTAANKRLLQQALRIAEKSAKRGRAAAVTRKDVAAVEDIDDLLTFSLSLEPQPEAAEEDPEQALINKHLKK